MKSNFEFLNRYWPVLAQLGANAENYLYSDPNACIYKIGLFSERLVQEILLFENMPEPETDNTHSNRIRMLKRAGLLPRDIDNTLYLLRRTRNSAVHTGAESVDDAKTLLSMTYVSEEMLSQFEADPPVIVREEISICCNGTKLQKSEISSALPDSILL